MGFNPPGYQGNKKKEEEKMSRKESTNSRRCMVCGREVPEREWFFINAGVTGNFMDLGGHSTCMNNVDNLIVGPNRIYFLEMIELISCFPRGSRILNAVKAYYEGPPSEKKPASVAGPEAKDVALGKHRSGGLSSGRLRTSVAG